jgi:hypothetical protein
LKLKALLLDGGGLGGGVAAEVKTTKDGLRRPSGLPPLRPRAHHHPFPSSIEEEGGHFP